uniref:P53-induced protein with a death domain-like n=1 Tax=Saccoglossus kowalevskii TaxID=10224 RepID=A0ABM0MVV3_SACKO|nr:PREDICTED: p53-induced protein with a death domain-like [Saccoglossus kowalevskii]
MNRFKKFDTSLEEIDLNGEGLTAVPPSISSVTNLNKLDLSDNDLSILPGGIAKLKQLKELNLSMNAFQEIPSCVYELKTLTLLLALRNNIKTLSSDIALLNQLTVLNVSFNQMNSIPPAVYNLHSLRELHVCGNNISSIAQDISKLTELHTLNVSDNNIKVLPSSVFHLRGLKDLRINNNKIMFLSSEISQLEQLERLDVHGNKLSGIPTCVFKLMTLRELDLGFNQLSFLPKDSSQLHQLWRLNMSYNKLTEIPPCVFGLKTLKQLHLRGNDITTVPDTISQLKILETLDISSNQIHELPSGIGELGKLVRMYARSNAMTSISSNIGKLQYLEVLNLSNNNLMKLPPTFENLVALEKLDLSNNEFHKVPESLKNLSKCEVLVNENPISTDNNDDERENTETKTVICLREAQETRKYDLPGGFFLMIPPDTIRKHIDLTVTTTDVEVVRGLNNYKWVESKVTIIKPTHVSLFKHVILGFNPSVDNVAVREYVILYSDDGALWHETSTFKDVQPVGTEIRQFGFFVAVSRSIEERFQIDAGGGTVKSDVVDGVSLTVPPGYTQTNIEVTLEVHTPNQALVDNVCKSDDSTEEPDISFGPVVFVSTKQNSNTAVCGPISLTMTLPAEIQQDSTLKLIADKENKGIWQDVTDETECINRTSTSISIQTNNLVSHTSMRMRSGLEKSAEDYCNQVVDKLQQGITLMNILLLQNVSDPKQLLVALVEKSMLQQRIEEFTNNGFGKLNGMHYSLDIQMKDSERVYIQLPDDCRRKTKIDNCPYYASLNTHWTVEVEPIPEVFTWTAMGKYTRSVEFYKDTTPTAGQTGKEILAELQFVIQKPEGQIVSKERIPKNVPVSKEHTPEMKALISVVARELPADEWKFFARDRLAIMERDLESIVHDYGRLMEQKYQMLLLWLENSEGHATVNILLEHLKHHKLKNVLFEVEKQLKIKYS